MMKIGNMALKLGDKVICISDNWKEYFKIFGMRVPKPWKVTGPKKDVIYIIKDIAQYTEFVNVTVLKFSEFPEWWYSELSFRKIDESFAEGVLEKVKEEIEEFELQQQHQQIEKVVSVFITLGLQLIFGSNKNNKK